MAFKKSKHVAHKVVYRLYLLLFYSLITVGGAYSYHCAQIVTDFTHYILTV